MPDRKLSYGVEIQDQSSATGKQIARNFKQSMKSVQGDLDDTSSTAKKLADVVGKMADDINQKLDNVEAIAEHLGDSMPDEDARKFAAALDAAGLSADELGDDTDELVAQMRRLEEAGERAGMGVRKGTDVASDGVRKLGDESDQSRSVIANMAGNATQDLGALGGVAGTAGVAIGQLAEYAADGNIKLKSLVGLVGGMVVIGAATKAFADHMERIAESDALRSEHVDAYTDAIRAGEAATSKLREELDETGQLMVAFGEAGTGDVAPAIDGLGLSIDQFSQLAGKSEEEIRAWAQAMADAGGESDALIIVEAALLSTHNDLAAAEERAAVTTRLLGHETGATAEEMQAAREAGDRYREALEALNEAQDSALGNNIDLREAMLNTADALDQYAATLADAEASDRDKERAGLDLIATMQQEAEAAGRSAYDQAVAAGNAAGAQAASTAAQIESLSRLAQNLAPGSFLRRAIDDHIMRLFDIPTSIETRVRVNASYGQGTDPLSPRGQRAIGGPTSRGGLYEVTEQGSELLHEGGKTYLMAGSDGQVEPLTQAGGSMSGGGGGGIVVNVTAGFGADGDDIANKIVDLLTRWQRSNGSLPWAS